MGEARWVHIGTAWTNGQPFLALDAALFPAWRGYSAGHYDSLIDLGPEVTSVPVGAGSAALISTDGTVYDEGWLEFYRADGPKIAVVQAAGREYPAALSAALTFPDDDDELGDIISVGSGSLVLLDACIDGDGEHSAPILPEAPGPSPTTRRRFDYDLAEIGGIRISVPPGRYRLSVRWLTEIPRSDVYFVRWILRFLS